MIITIITDSLAAKSYPFSHFLDVMAAGREDIVAMKASIKGLRFIDEGLPAFDPDEFVEALDYVQQALLCGGNPFGDLNDSEDFAIPNVNSEGTLDWLPVDDSEEMRVMIAVAQRYHTQREVALNFLIRFRALPSVLMDRRIGRWVSPSRTVRGQMNFAVAVFHAAAVTNVDDEMEFLVDEFYSNVRRIDEERNGPLRFRESKAMIRKTLSGVRRLFGSGAQSQFPGGETHS